MHHTRAHHHHSGQARKMPDGRTRHFETMDWILLRTVQPQIHRKPRGTKCSPSNQWRNDHPILREEVEAAVKALKKGKSAGVDNIPGELVQAGGEAMVNVLTTICNKIWQTGRMADTLDAITGDHTPQERQLATMSELPHHQPNKPPQ